MFFSGQKKVDDDLAILAESEFNLSPFPRAIVSEHGTVVRCNRAFARFLGLSESEILSKPADFVELTHPDDVFDDATGFVGIKSGDIDHYFIGKKRWINSMRDVYVPGGLSVYADPERRTRSVMAVIVPESPLVEENRQLRETIVALKQALRAIGDPEIQALIDKVHQGGEGDGQD